MWVRDVGVGDSCGRVDCGMVWVRVVSVRVDVRCVGVECGCVRVVSVYGVWCGVSV